MLNSPFKQYCYRPLAWTLLIISLVTGCSPASSQVDANNNVGLDGQDTRCVEDAIYIERGGYIAGSDEAERDYAYQISAESLANTPEEVAELKTRLRQQRWFDFEPDSGNQHMAAFCISHHLVTKTEPVALASIPSAKVPTA